MMPLLISTVDNVISGFKQNPFISTIAIPTFNRPAELERCLVSYLENQHRWHRADGRVIIADGSVRSEIRLKNRRILTDISLKYNVNGVYCGLEEKLKLAKYLMACNAAPPDVIKFSFFDSEQTGLPTTGTNRNILLLYTKGRNALHVDDDTVCRIAVSPEAQADFRALEEDPFTSTHPCSTRFFPNWEKMIDVVKFRDDDVFAIHERLLGGKFIFSHRSFNATVKEGDKSESNEAKIRVTIGGVVGDCGWAVPWHWALVGESLDALTVSESTYRASIVSRSLLRLVRKATISSRTRNSLGLFVGMDHHQPLPPYVPVGRGQDTIFWITLATTCPAAYIGHLPAAILHSPVHFRSFWPREIAESASGISLDQFFSLLIESTGFSLNLSDDYANMRNLGKALEKVGLSQTDNFIAEVSKHAKTMVECCTTTVLQRLQNAESGRAFWANDVRTYLRALNKAALQPDFGIPLELRNGRDSAAAAKLGQKLVFRFGQLLYYWPDIVEAMSGYNHTGDA